jgi:UrcA family protein
MNMARIIIPVLAFGFMWSVPFAAGPAFAQAGAQATENVIIRAPLLRPVPDSGSGLLAGRSAPHPETVSLTRAVSYSDLNLSRALDVAELESRVRNTAHALCRDLVRDFASASIRTNNAYPSRDCVRNATYDGMRNVRMIRASLARR